MDNFELLTIRSNKVDKSLCFTTVINKISQKSQLLVACRQLYL